MIAVAELTAATAKEPFFAADVGITGVAHLVAESIDNARNQWVDVFNRDRADLGPGHAAVSAADDIDRYGPTARPPAAVGLQAAALRDSRHRSPLRPPEPIPATQPTSRGIDR